jgi:hypothetical protein
MPEQKKCADQTSKARATELAASLPVTTEEDGRLEWRMGVLQNGCFSIGLAARSD